MKVYWTNYEQNRSDTMFWTNFAFFEPEPAYKSMINVRNKEVVHFKCPAVQEYFKNTFLIRSPVDLTISFEDGRIRTHQYDQEFFDSFVNRKTNDGIDVYETIIFGADYVFYSDKPCIVEQLPAFMEDSSLQRSIRVVPGTFDISKWIRPMQCAFEIVDIKKPIIIKRGDPLFYVRLIPQDGSKITLERIDDDEHLHKIVYSCVTLKDFVANNSLRDNYEMAKSYLKLWRRGRKSKCPFHFWK